MALFDPQLWKTTTDLQRYANYLWNYPQPTSSLTNGTPYTVGDRVLNCTPNGDYSDRRNFKSGWEATVIGIDYSGLNHLPVSVRYDNGEEGRGAFGHYSLITKPKKSMTTKLGIMMKKLLDADTQTLVKAGFINGDLELTSEGRYAQDTLVFDDYKAKLVALAQAKLDEEAKNAA